MRAAWALGGAAVAVQISYPLTTGPLRDAVSVTVVLLLAAAALVHAAVVRGPRWAGALALVTAVGGFGVELLGTATGVPFGEYAYAPGRLGPELAGVPLLIGVAWTAGAYPAWCVADRVVGTRALPRLLLAAVGLAAWDLYLDPQMVADGRWTWVRRDAGLPGVAEVPVGNYLGWLGVALVMAALLTLVPRAPGPRRDGLPVALYLWTWLGSALAHAVFLGLPASAGYGLLGMGLLGVPLLVVLRRERTAARRPRPPVPARGAGGARGLAPRRLAR